MAVHTCTIGRVHSVSNRTRLAAKGHAPGVSARGRSSVRPPPTRGGRRHGLRRQIGVDPAPGPVPRATIPRIDARPQPLPPKWRPELGPYPQSSSSLSPGPITYRVQRIAADVMRLSLGSAAAVRSSRMPPSSLPHPRGARPNNRHPVRPPCRCSVLPCLLTIFPTIQHQYTQRNLRDPLVGTPCVSATVHNRRSAPANAPEKQKVYEKTRKKRGTVSAVILPRFRRV